MLFDFVNNIDDEDIYLKIRYSYAIGLKKIDSFSKELLKFNYDKGLLIYIKNYIKEISDVIYSKNNKKKTLKFENDLLVSNKLINLEIIFYALNRLSKKRIIKKNITKDVKLDKKEKLLKKLEKNLMTKLEYKRMIDKLDSVSLVLFIEYAIDNIQNKSE